MLETSTTSSIRGCDIYQARLVGCVETSLIDRHFALAFVRFVLSFLLISIRILANFTAMSDSLASDDEGSAFKEINGVSMVPGTVHLLDCEFGKQFLELLMLIIIQWNGV